MKETSSMDAGSAAQPEPQAPLTDRSATLSLRGAARWLAGQLAPNLATFLVAALLVLGARVWAKPLLDTPQTEPNPSATTINYQGRLADPLGNPLDGSFAMSFTLWDAPTGGSQVWGPEEHPGVEVSEGLFHIALGSATSGGIAASTWSGDRYLEISIEGETLSPREPIRSVPVAGLALSVPDGAITSRNLAPTLFTTHTSGQAPIGDASNPTPVLALTVDFAIDAQYLILAQVSTRRDTAGGITAFLEDEAGNPVLGSTLHMQHGANGLTSASASALHSFQAGTHTLRLRASSDDGDLSGAVTDAQIIALPFGQ